MFNFELLGNSVVCISQFGMGSGKPDRVAVCFSSRYLRSGFPTVSIGPDEECLHSAGQTVSLRGYGSFSSSIPNIPCKRANLENLQKAFEMKIVLCRLKRTI